MKNLNFKFFLCVICTIQSISILLAQPSWSVNPNEYEYSMTVTGLLFINGAYSNNVNDVIGVFNGETCVGLASPDVVFNDYNMIFMIVFSNELSDSLDVRVFNSLTNEIIEYLPIEFSIDAINGSVDNPFVFFQYPIIYGCIDSLAFNYNANANTDDGSCIAVVAGCTDSLACNYDSTAVNSSDCVYSDIYYDCNGTCLNDADANGICDELEIYGCMDSLACNYDSTAVNSGDCTYAETYYDCNGMCLNDTDVDEVCDEIDNCIDISNIDQIDSDNDGDGDECDYDDNIGIEQVEDAAPQLIKMIDILGREQKEHKRGTILFYIYDNGIVEKKLNILNKISVAK